MEPTAGRHLSESSQPPEHLAKAAKHVNDEENDQYRPKLCPRPAACAEAAIAVITAIATE
jgi:hypothetical protein